MVRSRRSAAEGLSRGSGSRARSVITPRGSRAPGRRTQEEPSEQPMQLSLSMGTPPAGEPARPVAVPPRTAKRLTTPRETPYPVTSETDEILRTRDVVRIIKHHRCTLFRWVRAKKFPAKHKLAGLSPGWRRSDVMAWLAGEKPRG